MIKKLYFILATTIIYLMFFSTPVHAQTDYEFDFSDYDNLKTNYYYVHNNKGGDYIENITKIEDGYIYLTEYHNGKYTNYVFSIDVWNSKVVNEIVNTYYPNSAENYIKIISIEEFNNMKTFGQIKEEEEKEKENGNGNSEENNTDNGETGGTGTDGDNTDTGDSENGEDDNGNQGNSGEQGTDTEQGNHELDGKSAELLEHIYNAIIIQTFVVSAMFGACVCGFAIKFRF